jgi:hypothetical protein
VRRSAQNNEGRRASAGNGIAFSPEFAHFAAIHTYLRMVRLTAGGCTDSYVRASRGGIIRQKEQVMSIRTAILCAALGIGAAAAPTIGSARVYVDVDVAPPAAQVEVIPASRAGYVWAPGYWNYQGHRHVWVGGRSIRERRGNHWVGDSWEQRGERWHHTRGHWDHD